MSRKIVIIGGGVAGLSAGIYGRLNGFETEIIEMHSITGGQCTAWKRKGYRFDYCLHWLVGTRNGPFNDIWKETNVLNDTVKVIDQEIHTKIFDASGREFIIYTNLDQWEKYLCSFAPEDTVAIRKMCREMRKSAFLSPYADPPGIRNPLKYLLSMVSMWPIMTLFMKYGRKNTKHYFDAMNLKNQVLRSFFDSMFGSRDFSALAFIMMFAWFNQKNAGYLIGGSLPMAERMTEKYLKLGGKLTTRKRVSEITVQNNEARGVILDDGTKVAADYVISAADGHSTLFDMLGGNYLSPKITNAYDNWDLFTPLVQVSFGIRKVIPSDSPVNTHLEKEAQIGKTITEQGYSFMNYQFDPTMAPEGKSVIVMRFESPWENWKEMTKEEYAAEKVKIREDAIMYLEKHYPGIAAYIEEIDVATPLTDVEYTGVWKGSYEGFLPSSKNLMDNIPPKLPGLRKFYMAGQWLFPGGGLPPAGQSGKWAIQYICKEEKKKFRTTLPLT